MPPKRKNKAATKRSKATTPLPAPQTAGAIRTSSIKRRRSSVQGGKTSTSRLQPSEPLHMTTRRGAARAASNDTIPAAPSVAGGSSRRSSLNDSANFQVDHSDVEDERPVKRSRVSTDSGSPPNQMSSFASQHPDVVTDVEPTSQAVSRSSNSPINKRKASDVSYGTSKTASAAPNALVTRSESDLSEMTPRRKKRKTTGTSPEPAEAPPELTDASTPPASPEATIEVAGSQGFQNVLPTVNGEIPAKATRRLPGRRRQPHSDINVETALRRQLNIKMGYRSLAKIQKSILEELSKRTINNLESDPDYHMRCPEYKPLMDELDQRFQQRMDKLNAERQLKLGQVERVLAAEEHIQREMCTLRKTDFQDNFLLQSAFRLKQLERQRNADNGYATDDQEHIVEPTRIEFPAHLTKGISDDRLTSRYASRSRAYVETERMIEADDRRRRFAHARKAFLADNEDLDDSIDNLPDDFASFVGPDRTEALAHYNVESLVDAAAEIEKISAQPEPPKIIPNEQADALLLLACISAERSAKVIPQKQKDEVIQQKDEVIEQNDEVIEQKDEVIEQKDDVIQQKDDVIQQKDEVIQQKDEVISPLRVATPAEQIDLLRNMSPSAPLSIASTGMSLETTNSTPSQLSDGPEIITQTTPRQEAISFAVRADTDIPKNETPARMSTHKITDLLNEDQDVLLPKMREPRVSQPPIQKQAPQASPTRDYEPSQVEDHDYLKEKSPQTQPATAEPESQPHCLSPPHSNQYWSSKHLSTLSEQADHKDKRSPMDRIRSILDRNAEKRHRVHEGNEDSVHDRPEEHESAERQQMAPPYSRPFSPQGSHSENYSRRASQGTYSESPSNGPSPYERSPRDRHNSYVQSNHQHSYDQGPRHRDNDRYSRESDRYPRESDRYHRDSDRHGSQAPPPTYSTGNPSQSYAHDYGRSGPTPPVHQSPYPPSNTHPPLPSISQTLPNSLPPKPPAPPNSSINIRFAHYDPVPPRTSPFHHHSWQPPHAQSSPTGLQHQPQYGPSPYPGQASNQGYVPPPGSFQAPPPPSAGMSPYQPVKIHQYGGQPILPANMAPPPHSQSPMPPYNQNQHPPATAYSPQRRSPPRPHYEHAPAPPLQERAVPQSRPRRQYRSYNAPGTEFRPYQGPSKRVGR